MKPILQAILVADNIYEDKLSGKKVIAGVFRNYIIGKEAAKKDEDEEIPLSVDQENASDGLSPSKGSEASLIRAVPAGERSSPRRGITAGSPSLFASLTEIVGLQHIEFRFVHLNSNKILMTFTIPVETQSPISVHELVVNLPVLPITKPGIYAFEVLCMDEPLGMFRISAEEKEYT